MATTPIPETRLTIKLKIGLPEIQLTLMAVMVMFCAPVAADEVEEKADVASRFSYGSRGLQFEDVSGNN